MVQKRPLEVTTTKLSDSLKGKNIEKVLPITVRPSRSPLFLGGIANRLDQEIQVGNGSSWVVVVKPAEGPVC